MGGRLAPPLSKRRDGHHKKALFTTAQYGGHPAARDSEAGDGSVLGFGDPVATQARRYTSRPSDDFDVLADGAVVGRIFKANAAPVGSPWIYAGLRRDARGRNGGLHEELAPGN